jgi:hypothetical protein
MDSNHVNYHHWLDIVDDTREYIPAMLARLDSDWTWSLDRYYEDDEDMRLTVDVVTGDGGPDQYVVTIAWRAEWITLTVHRGAQKVISFGYHASVSGPVTRGYLDNVYTDAMRRGRALLNAVQF